MHDLPPLVKTVRVAGDAGAVFELFTSRLGEWWPLATHSVAGEDAVGAHLEPEVGGRLYEVAADGSEHEWGSVVELSAAARIVLRWHPGMPADQSTLVEIDFLQSGDETVVTLTHSGWEVRGDRAEAVRNEYDPGWDYVLARVPGTIRV